MGLSLLCTFLGRCWVSLFLLQWFLYFSTPPILLVIKSPPAIQLNFKIFPFLFCFNWQPLQIPYHPFMWMSVINIIVWLEAAFQCRKKKEEWMPTSLYTEAEDPFLNEHLLYNRPLILPECWCVRLQRFDKNDRRRGAYNGRTQEQEVTW